MATIMRFLISILLLLALPVYGQLNPTAFSKGLVNTNDTAAKWRTGIGALAATNGTAYTLTNRGHFIIATNGSGATAANVYQNAGENGGWFLTDNNGVSYDYGVFAQQVNRKLVLNAPNQISLSLLNTNGNIQLGGAGLQNGTVTIEYEGIATAAIPYRTSKKLLFGTSYWNGSGGALTYPDIIGIPSSSSGDVALYLRSQSDFNSQTAITNLTLAKTSTRSSLPFYIGTAAGGATTAPAMLDVSFGGAAGMLLGADLNAQTRTPNTGKNFYAGTASYGNTTPVALFSAANGNGTTTLTIGGSVSGHNAVTDFEIYTGATPTSGTGTRRLFFDRNGNAIFTSNLYYKAPILNKTSNYTVSTSDSGAFFGNDGASGTVTNTLPTAAAGLIYTFTVVAGNNVTVRAAGTDLIQMSGAASSAGGGIFSNSNGDTITLVSYKAGFWHATSKQGTWTGF